MVAKKKKLTPDHNRLLRLGAPDKLPYYSVVGDCCNFYLWITEADNRGSSTNRITGRQATQILDHLRQLLLKDRSQFTKQFRAYYKEHAK